jgi:methionine-gamma-lyase
MKQHSHNAMYLAELKKDGLKRFYPGLKSHPSHELYSEINHEYGFGGMMTLDVGTLRKSQCVNGIDACQKILGILAVSLGFINLI